MFKRVISCFLLFFVLSHPFKADTLYTVIPGVEPERISGKFLYLEDPTNKLELKDIIHSQNFKHTKAEVPNFNITTSTIWAKIKLTGKEKDDWFLSLDPGSYNEVSLFQRKGYNGEWKKTTLGYNSPRTVAVNHYMFKLNLSENDTTLVVFRLNDYFPITLDFKIAPLEQFVSGHQNINLYNGICFGIMIMMMIYNLYLFITNRTIIYIYYVLYVFFSIIFTGYLGGYGLHFPAWFNKIMLHIPIIPPASFGIFGMLFTLQLFKENLSKRFKKIVFVFMSLAVGDIILSITPYKQLSENIIQPLGLFLAIISITAGVIAIRKKNSSAVYYLLGFGAYMVSLFYLILSAQGLFSINGFTWQCLLTGSMLESIMLSFALGDKFKMAQKENERLILEQNVMLEKKVKERTLELQVQKELVEEKNKEMTDSINYAKRIQNALITSEQYIDKSITRLKKDQ